MDNGKLENEKNIDSLGSMVLHTMGKEKENLPKRFIPQPVPRPQLRTDCFQTPFDSPYTQRAAYCRDRLLIQCIESRYRVYRERNQCSPQKLMYY
jgi:hypothetical protein